MIVIKFLTLASLGYAVYQMIKINPCYRWHIGLGLVLIYQAINAIIPYYDYDDYIRPISTILAIIFFIEIIKSYNSSKNKDDGSDIQQ